jgi:four helix bundle protein
MAFRPEELRQRTKQFAIRAIRLFRALPRTEEARVIGRQLLRSATSVAANYRAVCRARSRAEFVAKMGIVLEEADESSFWVELLSDAGIVEKSKLTAFMEEAEELIRIFHSSIQTAKRKS